MTADDILALNTILEVRPHEASWSLFLSIAVGILAVLVGLFVALCSRPGEDGCVRPVTLIPTACAVALMVVTVPMGYANSANEDILRADWEARPERTGACRRLSAAVEAGRVRWLDAPSYRTFANRCGSDVAIASANAEGVDFAVGETDAPRRR